jgi:hypothetical protein
LYLGGSSWFAALDQCNLVAWATQLNTQVHRACPAKRSLSKPRVFVFERPASLTEHKWREKKCEQQAGFAQADNTLVRNQNHH